MLEKILNRIEPHAKDLCKELSKASKKKSKSNCHWEFEIVSSNSFNAYASGANKLTFYTGLVRGVKYEEELAFVIAHEIAHHIGDHISKATFSSILGALVGGLLGAGTGMSSDITAVGAYIGNLSGSKAREAEADALAAIILSKAKYDLLKARIGLIRMTRIGFSKSTSNFFDSHPSGPERIRAFDEITKDL